MIKFMYDMAVILIHGKGDISYKTNVSKYCTLGFGKTRTTVLVAEATNAFKSLVNIGNSNMTVN